MRKNARQLAALKRIADLRSDQQLARFAAIGAQVGAAEARIARLQAEMIEVAEGSAGSPAQASSSLCDDPLIGARLAQALTRAIALEREAAIADRAGLQPQFEEALGEAVAAFGKAQVLTRLGEQAASEGRARRS